MSFDLCEDYAAGQQVRTREAGLDWLARTGRSTGERVAVSKYYHGYEAFPHRPVWFFEFPVPSATDDPAEHVNLLCEVNGTPGEFHHLRIPFAYLLERMNDLCIRTDQGRTRFALYVSAETPTLFRELRGNGRLDLRGYRVT